MAAVGWAPHSRQWCGAIWPPFLPWGHPECPRHEAGDGEDDSGRAAVCAGGAGGSMGSDAALGGDPQGAVGAEG